MSGMDVTSRVMTRRQLKAQGASLEGATSCDMGVRVCSIHVNTVLCRHQELLQCSVHARLLRNT